MAKKNSFTGTVTELQGKRKFGGNKELKLQVFLEALERDGQKELRDEIFEALNNLDISHQIIADALLEFGFVCSLSSVRRWRVKFGVIQ